MIGWNRLSVEPGGVDLEATEEIVIFFYLVRFSRYSIRYCILILKVYPSSYNGISHVWEACL